MIETEQRRIERATDMSIVDGLLAAPLMTQEEIVELMATIPRALSPDQVNKLGILAYNFLRHNVHPHDMGERLDQERRALFWLAKLSVEEGGDTVTAENAADTLRNRGGLKNHLAAYRVRRMLPKKD